MHAAFFINIWLINSRRQPEKRGADIWLSFWQEDLNVFFFFLEWRFLITILFGITRMNQNQLSICSKEVLRIVAHQHIRLVDFDAKFIKILRNPSLHWNCPGYDYPVAMRFYNFGQYLIDNLSTKCKQIIREI